MSFAHYLLQVNIYLIVFYIFYKILLEKETYFVLNRIYLLSATLISLVIPFVKLNWLTEQKVSQQVYATVNWQAVLEKTNVIAEKQDGFDWFSWTIVVYLIGSIFFVFKLVYHLSAIKARFDAEAEGAAFSFLWKKFIDKKLPESDIIEIHEHTHVKQLHTLDVLLFEIVGILNWFNPIVWAYKKSIKTVHEFLADEVAAEYKGDKKAYSLLLLSKSMGVEPNVLISSFRDKSVLKKRIFMLHKDRSKKTAIFKYGVFIPLFVFLVILSSASISKNKALKSVAAKFPVEERLRLVEENLNPNDSIVSPVPQKDNKIEINSLKSKIESVDSVSIPEEKAVEKQEVEEAANDKIYDFVSIEKQPEFPGGIKSFYEFIGKTIKYPAIAQENGIQGKVFLSFVVEQDGSLSDIQITRGLGSGTDEEAIRVLKECPKWNPGIQNGRPVRVKYNININFSLSNAKPRETDDKREIKLTNPTTVRGFKFSGDKTTPLVILDDNNNMEYADFVKIDPKEISSISIFKSKEAVLKYGRKGANGVILVQTKNGFKEKIINANQLN